MSQVWVLEAGSMAPRTGPYLPVGEDGRPTGEAIYLREGEFFPVPYVGDGWLPEQDVRRMGNDDA
jgi:hypothetical protein